MTEKPIAAGIMRWLRSEEFTVAWKVGDLNNVGFPDIVGLHRGVWFSFEVKSAKGRTTPKQDYEAKRIEAALGRHAVVRSLSEAKRIFIQWFGDSKEGI